ncbi:Multidrug resistance-associated protein 6 [Coemansia sp. RSA 2424]|nr:Multidrug resistance-associated protein 6 [Coemansia sp. RSA 2424]
MPNVRDAADAADTTTSVIARAETVPDKRQAVATRSLPANTDPTSTQAEALQYFVRVCGVCTLVTAAAMGIVMFAVPTILYQQQVSSTYSAQWTGRSSLAWVAADVLSVCLVFVVKEYVYVGLARSWIQPALLDSLARAQMSEIWRSSEAQLVSVVRCTERATALGVHVFLAESAVMIANLAFVAYSTLRLSYIALVGLVLASAGVVYYRLKRGSGSLLTIQRFRRRIQVDMDRTAHDLFSGSRVVRIHGIYSVFGDKLRELDGRQQAVGALANAVLFTRYLWQHMIDSALSLGLVGAMLMTDVGSWQLTPVSVQLYYETASKLLSLLNQLANIQANATNHALVLQELCDMGRMAPEAPWRTNKQTKKRQASGALASQGRILFAGCSLRYKQGDELALKGVTVNIRAGERVGIVGRTGSGKSSLLYALLRVVELELGSISIDSTDISRIGLHDLRKSISVVSQTAALLEGTVRSNIDPFEEHSEAEIATAIRACQLGELGADKQIEGGGRNLSAGQQQLVSICRAVLRRKKILVLDEATANVDEHTERVISVVIEREFRHSTVLIIAHRLEATAACSRILVMDSGRLVEQGPPAVLAARGGHYARLLRAASDNSKSHEH